MNKKVVHLIAAARPNFMKIAPLYHELSRHDWAIPYIVHTGQHYDVNMSDAFFKDLDLPEPHIHLGVGSGSHAEQTGNVMIAYEKILMKTQPDMVVVAGDVNSTIACTLAAVKINYAIDGTLNTNIGSKEKRRRPIVAHLEAGLRSFDRDMPEEINRLATDVLADILWTPSPDGDEHLKNEGIDQSKIIRVGNIMIDSLEMLREKVEQQSAYADLGLDQGNYGVVTLHRPSNVDDPAVLKKLAELLVNTSKKIPLVFPVHPRTRKNLEASGYIESLESCKGMMLLDPVSYIRFMNLVFNCRFVLTDSGGIQEETTYLGIPCLTLRPNTERPITVTQGTNQLSGLDTIEELIGSTLSNRDSNSKVPELWDGKTATRVVQSIKRVMNI